MKAQLHLRAFLFACLAASACQEADEVISPGANTRVEVTSDPEGASIFLDGTNTGKLTNQTLFDVRVGPREVVVQFPGPGRFYGYRSNIDVKPDSLHRVTGPLTMFCTTQACTTDTRRNHTLNNIRASTIPNGALFYHDATEKGLIWPATGNSGYAAIGTPMIAAVSGTRDTLSLGIYNVDYMAGRPSPQVISTAEQYTMRQTFWVIPPSDLIFTTTPMIRGIEVEEELTGTSAAGDVAFIKLTFRNITNRPSYQAIDPFLSGGITYTWVYVGFGLDAEVGLSDDDAVTYDPSLNMVYMYDLDFIDTAFPAGPTSHPGMIGLRMLEAPAGATIAMNAWPRGSDWIANETTSAKSGWYHFSGTRPRPELATFDIPGQHIGYAPNTGNDYRMSVSAGPLTLAPGESATINVAVILAYPTPGAFVSGQPIPPENPMVVNRAIQAAAKDLLDKARSLTPP